MARPPKQGLEYFPTDVDIFHDAKIRKILRACGSTAPSVILCLLCNIYRNGYYAEWDKESPFLIAEDTGVSEGAITEIVSKAMQVGFFDANMYNEHKILTSRGIQERFFSAITRRKAVSVRRDFLLVNVNACNNPINADIMHTETGLLHTSIHKVKKSKGKESISPPTPSTQTEPASVSKRVEEEMYRLMGGAKPGQLDVVAEWVGKWGEGAVISAMQRAQVNGSRRLGYVQSILESGQAKTNAAPKQTPRLFSQQAQDEETARAREAIIKSRKE